MAGPFNYSTVFGDGMVVQYGAKWSVYGYADAGDNVTVSLNGSPSGTGTADANGHWKVMLAPIAAGGSHSISASRGSSGPAAELHDVTGGDVYFCSGQSNSKSPAQECHEQALSPPPPPPPPPPRHRARF
jgi:sialate O-acetylesterase